MMMQTAPFPPDPSEMGDFEWAAARRRAEEAEAAARRAAKDGASS